VVRLSGFFLNGVQKVVSSNLTAPTIFPRDFHGKSFGHYCGLADPVRGYSVAIPRPSKTKRENAQFWFMFKLLACIECVAFRLSGRIRKPT